MAMASNFQTKLFVPSENLDVGSPAHLPSLVRLNSPLGLARLSGLAALVHIFFLQVPGPQRSTSIVVLTSQSTLHSRL